MHTKVKGKIAVFINSLVQTGNVSHNKYVTKRKQKTSLCFQQCATDETYTDQQHMAH
jgi:hypothetical protein